MQSSWRVFYWNRILTTFWCTSLCKSHVIHFHWTNGSRSTSSPQKKIRCGTWKYLFCDLQNEVLGSFLGFTNPPYGCFLKWWYPQNTPKWSFLVGKPMGLLGNYHHFRSCPHRRLQGTYRKCNPASDLRFHLHWWARTDLKQIQGFSYMEKVQVPSPTNPKQYIMYISILQAVSAN